VKEEYKRKGKKRGAVCWKNVGKMIIKEWARIEGELPMSEFVV